MTAITVPRGALLDEDYRELLETLSQGSVHVNFDPYEDIAWDAPEMAVDPNDPAWVLSPEIDPLGATSWYQQLSADRQREIAMARVANAIRVGAAFESMLIRGLMQFAVALPNGSPEFRYCLHEMTEECNHIQMFQELVNRIGIDVPGMRTWLRLASPFVGGGLAYLPVALMISILAGEEPIDHYQKATLREDRPVPAALRRTMEIHIAEEARHISFAQEFLRLRLKRVGRAQRLAASLCFPVAMRIACGEIMSMPWPLARELGIPREVHRQAFWRSPKSRQIMADYFGDMRALAADTGLMNPVSRHIWKALHIDGEPSGYRGEPVRRARTVS